ncbi:barstar family protein [Nocardioides donggukensis]|uniref:Barstar family protein n=1 Tax=Nocardioides donggukensis TaxID=2774019 RepID=A0A927K331_9ACTN|nr:barstar family protein [Nocardioides donggukensis]MBD8869194.1 barstar family protein [Nocardioides donggukensis]
MSGLASVLAGRHAPGVYRWHGNFDAADVRHAVEHAGWAYGHLDGWEIEHKAEFLAAVGEALSFPDYYGQNLDALADCLADLPATVLLWDGWSAFARAEPVTFHAGLDVLAQRARDEPSTPFVVLLRGEGPDLPAVPLLE